MRKEVQHADDLRTTGCRDRLQGDPRRLRALVASEGRAGGVSDQADVALSAHAPARPVFYDHGWPAVTDRLWP